MYRRRRQIGASGIYSSCWTFTVVCRYLLKSNALKCILFWLLRNSTNNGNLNYFHNYSSTLRSGSVKSELPFKIDWKWSVEDNNLGWLGELLAKQAKRNFILQHSPVIYTWLIPTLHPNRLITNNRFDSLTWRTVVVFYNSLFAALFAHDPGHKDWQVIDWKMYC